MGEILTGAPSDPRQFFAEWRDNIPEDGSGSAEVVKVRKHMAFAIEAIDAASEIEALRERVKEAEDSDEAAHAKLESYTRCSNPKCEGRTCACSYDRPEDICACHSPKLREAVERIADLERQLAGEVTEEGKEE